MASTASNLAISTEGKVSDQSKAGQNRDPQNINRNKELFKTAFDGANLAGIRGFAEDSARIDGPQMAGIRGFKDDDFNNNGPRMAGIRGYSEQSAQPGGPNFADTAGIMRIRGSGAITEPTVQFKNSGVRAYQDMLGMPMVAVG